MGICLNFNHCTIADRRSQLSHVQIGGRLFLTKCLPRSSFLFLQDIPVFLFVQGQQIVQLPAQGGQLHPHGVGYADLVHVADIVDLFPGDADDARRHADGRAVGRDLA